jgi:hypothetical protein
MDNDKLSYWANTMSVYRDDYPTRAAYLRAYVDANQHYDFKTRVEGGWLFFEYANDYDLWARQR